jgi:hypothetical protein
MNYPVLKRMITKGRNPERRGSRTLNLYACLFPHLTAADPSTCSASRQAAPTPTKVPRCVVMFVHSDMIRTETWGSGTRKFVVDTKQANGH